MSYGEVVVLFWGVVFALALLHKVVTRPRSWWRRDER